MHYLDFRAFFEEYALKDTFYSWFVFTEHHIRILTTRTITEGEDGTILRNGIVKALGIISKQTREEGRFLFFNYDLAKKIDMIP